ncbi:hypothetical protein PMIN03_009908 [Paraphaeosphaeria minitans]
MSDTPAPGPGPGPEPVPASASAPNFPQRQSQNQRHSQGQNQNHRQSQSYSYSYSYNQIHNPRRIPLHLPPPTAYFPSQQQITCHRLHAEILRLLISRRPRTLHIRQRYADTICPRRQGSAARVRERYGECKAVLGAVVLDLEVGFGVYEVEVEEGMGDGDVEGDGRDQGKKRSCVERRRWLEGVEKRIGLKQGVHGQVQDVSGVQEMPPLQRMSGRSEPFQEREASRRATDEGTGTEYAAVPAGEGMLHPGVPVSSRAGPGQIHAQRREDGQERHRGEFSRFRDQVSVARSARRENTTTSARSMGASPTSTNHSLSTTKAVVSMGQSNEASVAPKHSISEKKANVPETAIRSTSTVNAIVPSERSMHTLTGPTPPNMFKSMKYMVSGSKYLKRAMALRGSRQKKIQKQRPRSSDASVPSSSSSSHSADAKVPSTSTSVKSRGTTSDVPNEIAAGSFGARPPTGEKKNKEMWWSTLFSSKASSRDPAPGPGPWNKNAPWPLDPQQPPAEPPVGWKGSPASNEHVDYAPGPSSEVQRNDGEAPQRSFRLTCGTGCEPCRATRQRKRIAAPRTSPGEIANKAPRIRFEKTANKAPRPNVQQPRTKTPLPSLEQTAMRTPAVSVTSPSPPKTKLGYPPAKDNEVLPDRLAVARSALPRTPGYGVVPPLAPQLKTIPGDNDLRPDASTPLRLDGVVVDEEAIWTQCSKRLDYVSDITATEARERIRRARAQRVAQEAVRAHNLKERRNALAQEEMSTFIERRTTPEPVESVPSVRVFVTGTAERVQLKRVSVANVDCRSIAGRREVPSRRQTADPTTATRREAMLLQNQKQPPEDPSIVVRGLNGAIRGLHAAAMRAAAHAEISTTASTEPPVPRPLNTPWEAVWHRDMPIPLRQDGFQMADIESRASSVPYSLSGAVTEAEAREELHRLSPDEVVRLRKGLLAKRGRLVHGADGQRASMEAVFEDGMARFDSAMGMNEAQFLKEVKMGMEGGEVRLEGN